MDLIYGEENFCLKPSYQLKYEQVYDMARILKEFNLTNHTNKSCDAVNACIIPNPGQAC